MPWNSNTEDVISSEEVNEVKPEIKEKCKCDPINLNANELRISKFCAESHSIPILRDLGYDVVVSSDDYKRLYWE